MSACFANVTSITACTRKFVHDARTEPIKERIFHIEQVLKFKGRVNKFDVDGFAEVAQVLFQVPLHRTFFGCCTTEDAQGN